MANGTMTSVPIVIHFNVFKHDLPKLFTRSKPFTVNGFYFECVKKTFRDGVIPQGQAARS